MCIDILDGYVVSADGAGDHLEPSLCEMRSLRIGRRDSSRHHAKVNSNVSQSS